MERFGLWDRLRRVDHRVWDALLALGVFGYVLVDFLLSEETPLTAWLGTTVPAKEGRGPLAIPLFLLVGATIPLVWRRRAPLTVAAIIVVSDTALSLAGWETKSAIPVAIAVYTAAAYTERRKLILVLPPIALIGMVPLIVNQWGALDALLAISDDAAVPLILGRIVFNRRVRVARDRELAAHEAVTEERARIARELHDVVAHHMSVMVVQAAAARAVADRDPAAATGALREIERSGREGLGEMRRLLEILRSDERTGRLAPQPGLGRLDELLDHMRATGLPVERVVEGAPRPLPTAVDLSAYRIVQEALTNTLKHAGEAHARVLLRFQPDRLEIEVADDGRGPPPQTSAGGGRGLIGMRERAQLFGGTLECSPRPGGGFVVRACLPIGQETPT